MKQVLSLLLTGTLLLTLAVLPAAGQVQDFPSSPLSKQAAKAYYQPADPPGELILADMLVLRPVGLVACAVGLVGAFVTWPIAATSNSGDRVGRQLLIAPFKYTFERPLGQVDYYGGDADMPNY